MREEITTKGLIEAFSRWAFILLSFLTSSLTIPLQDLASGKQSKPYNQGGLGGLAGSLLGGQSSHGSGGHGGGGVGGLAGQLVGGLLSGGKPHNQQQHSGGSAGYGNQSGGHQQGGLGAGLGSFFGGHHGSSVRLNPPLDIEASAKGGCRTKIKTLDIPVAVPVPAAAAILVKLLQHRTNLLHSNHPANMDLLAVNTVRLNRHSNTAQARTHQIIMLRSTVSRAKVNHSTLKIQTIPSTSSHTLGRNPLPTANPPNKVTTLIIHPSPLLQPLGITVPLILPPQATVNKPPPTHLNPRTQTTTPIPANNILPPPRVRPHTLSSNSSNNNNNLAVRTAATVSLLSNTVPQGNILARSLVQAIQDNHTEARLVGKLMIIKAVTAMGSKTVLMARNNRRRAVDMVGQEHRQCPDGAHKVTTL